MRVQAVRGKETMKVPPLPASIPCKYCGSIESSLGMTDDDLVYVQCENLHCLARGPLASSPRDAVAKWNAAEVDSDQPEVDGDPDDVPCTWCAGTTWVIVALPDGQYRMPCILCAAKRHRHVSCEMRKLDELMGIGMHPDTFHLEFACALEALAKTTIKVSTGYQPGLGIRAMSIPPYDPEIPPIDYLNKDTMERDILATDAALRRHRDAAAVLEDASVDCLSKDMMKKFTISPDERLKDFNYVAGPSGPQDAAELEGEEEETDG